MGLLLNILAAPIMVPMKLTSSLAEKIRDMAVDNLTDEGPVRGQLLELQIRHELGEVDDTEFEVAEQKLIEEMDRIRKLKEMNLKRGTQ